MTIAIGLCNSTDGDQGPDQCNKCQELEQRPIRVPGRERVELVREKRLVVSRIPQAEHVRSRLRRAREVRDRSAAGRAVRVAAATSRSARIATVG